MTAVAGAAPSHPRDGETERFWVTVACVAGGLALLKGIRLPNRWAATQAQIDYSQGFVKRGLFGAAVANPLKLFLYHRFAVVSFGLFAALAVMLIVLARKSDIVKRAGGSEMLALYMGSYSVTMLASTVGYLDIPLALLAVGILFFRNPMVRVGFGVPLSIVGLMMHEMFLIVFLPVLLLSFLLQWMDEGAMLRRGQVLGAGLVLAFLALATGVRLALVPSMTQAQKIAMRDRIAARVDFEPRQQFYEVMTRSAKDNVSLMKKFVRVQDWQIVEVEGLAVYGPTVVLLLMASSKVLKASLAEWRPWVLGALVVSACAPLAMNAFGWDAARWSGLACFTAFLTFVVAVRFTSGPELVSSAAWQRTVAVTLLFSMASGGLLMLRDDRPFPPILQMFKLRHQGEFLSLAQIADLSD